MNSLLTLHQMVLEESGTMCGIDTSRDVETLRDRVKNEGDSFLTITLPQFSKDLQRALADGEVSPGMFHNFSKKRNSLIPVFLQGFMEIIFDPSNARVRHVWPEDVPSSVIDAIRCIFQVTGFAKKVLLPCSPKREQAAFDRYVLNETHVRKFDKERTSSLMNEFRIAASWLFDDVFLGLSSDIQVGRLRPSHGPGATNDKLYGNAKWSNCSWPDQLEAVFPLGEYGCANWRDYLERSQSGSVVPGTPNPVKVIGVPKTLETLRIIAVEQTAVMYMQQAIRHSIEDGIRRSKYAFSYICYDSQIPNQELARLGSSKGELATLDLSDASDMVSNQLVRTMLKSHPIAFEAIDATRTRTADVQGHGVMRLAKYASMGSALCFPFEAMVFATIIFVQLHRVYPELPWKSLRERFLGLVRVYGDDIIVPVEHAQGVADLLEAYGLKVNRNKSFWTGMFRESCGKEYYAGSDVTIARIRRMLPERRMPRDERVEAIVCAVALRNNLFHKGYYVTCDFLDEILLDHLNGVFPVIGPDSPALGRHSHSQPMAEKWDSELHRPLVRAYVVRPIKPDSPLDGWPAMLKMFRKTSELPNPDIYHLLKAGRSLSLRIKKEWVSPV